MLIPPIAPRPRAARAALGVYLAVVLAAILLDLRSDGLPPGHGGIGPLLALAVAMPVLTVLLWSAAPRTRLRLVTLVALLFSWLGDAFGFTFLIKLGFFLVAQIACCVAFWPYRAALRTRIPLLVAYGLGIAAAIAVVARSTGSLLIPVIVYGITLGLMAILAFGVSTIAGLGGLLFLLSDIELAVARFVLPGQIPEVDAINSVLYLPGQLLIVLGVVHRVHTDRRNAD